MAHVFPPVVRSLCYLATTVFVCLCATAPVHAQELTAIRGRVTDVTGATIEGATVILTRTDTGAAVNTRSAGDGRYQFLQLLPGTYSLQVSQTGFATWTENRVTLLVATPTTMDVTLHIEAVVQQVTVEARPGASVNTVDATRGNTLTGEEVRALPLVARNPIGLLTLQPGVVFTGQSDLDQLFQGGAGALDQREGVVNGIRGNQTNVTLDGARVNDFETQAAFTSVLPITADSVQEFRVTTANPNVTDGIAAGAQVQLVTRSGSNAFTGNLREYYRGTATAANSFFNKAAGLETPELRRHVFGGSLGGPIVRGRAFFFADYEGRRDARESTEARTGPNEDFKAGILKYRSTTGGIVTLGREALRTLDPTGRGINPAALQYLSQYPVGNSPELAPDGGLNLTGVRFNAPVDTRMNTLTLRGDVNLTADGRHRLFARAIYGDIASDAQPAHYPGLAPASQLLNGSRGIASGYTAQVGTSAVNTLRYAFTRQDVEHSGAPGAFLTTSVFGAYFQGGDFFTGQARPNGRVVPVHEVTNDFAWTRGAHTLSVGATASVTRNRRFDGNSFPTYYIYPPSLRSSASDPFNALLADGDPTNDPADAFQFNTALQSLTGTISLVDARFLVDPQTRTFLPAGSLQAREFAENGVEFYVQDSWRVRPNLTITGGLRYSYYTPVWETTGAQVGPTVDVQEWFATRQADMNLGRPADAAPLIGFDLAGPANDRPSWYTPDRNNVAPRIAAAYGPQFTTGIGRALFGAPGTSAVRAGFGVSYHRVGGALASALDAYGSPGLATAMFSDFSGVYDFASAPRYAGPSTPAGTEGLPDLSAYLSAPASADFPFAFSRGANAGGFMIDNRLRTPYSMTASFSVQRELPSRFTIDVGYVGTFGRQQLGYLDTAQYYGGLRDAASGDTLWGAYNRIVDIIGPDVMAPAVNPVNSSALAAIGPVAYFENMLPNLPAFLGRPELSPTQAFYVLAAGAQGNWTAPLTRIDTQASNGNSPWNAAIDPQRDGYVLFQPQYRALSTYMNTGRSDYNSLQVSLRRSVGTSLLGVNYVLSTSTDNGSAPENNEVIFGAVGADQIQNAFDPDASRAPSNFDVRHNLNAHALVDLPFGRGRRFGANAQGAVQQLIGGLSLSGILRWRSGFPLSVTNGVAYPTNALNQGPATLVGDVATSVTRHGANGSPNLFQDPEAALAQFAYTRPGSVGSRNVIRGPAYVSLDIALHKRLYLPWQGHRLEFRAIAFNALNTVNFATGYFQNTRSINSATFGALNGLAGSPRQMEFALRYEF